VGLPDAARGRAAWRHDLIHGPDIPDRPPDDLQATGIVLPDFEAVEAERPLRGPTGRLGSVGLSGNRWPLPFPTLAGTVFARIRPTSAVRVAKLHASGLRGGQRLLDAWQVAEHQIAISAIMAHAPTVSSSTRQPECNLVR
jgi:hypothetical protein